MIMKKTLPIHTELSTQTKKVFSENSISFGAGINLVLSSLIEPFKAISGRIQGRDGSITDEFSTIIYNGIEIKDGIVPVDSVAMVIESHDELTRENLKTSYERIKIVKNLEANEIITAVLVGKDSKLSLREIADEMEISTSRIENYLWVDLVSVLSKGTINYAAQVPGNEDMGDFIVTFKGMENDLAASLYIYKIIRTSIDYNFNKIFALGIQRISIFKAGLTFPGFEDILNNLPSNGMNIDNYQYNSKGKLLHMTAQQIVESKLPKERYYIVSGNSELGSLQYQPWQDGGIIILSGKFPIDIFFNFLVQVQPEISNKKMQYFKNKSGSQVSYVLPINETQFMQALTLFKQKSSNVEIKTDNSKILIKKMSEEGTSSPFIARLMLGIFDTQNIVSSKKEDRDHFYNLYEPILANLRSAREAAEDISQDILKHRNNVSSGIGVIFQGRAVRIEENIDRHLKRNLDSFLTSIGRAVKTALQNLTNDLGINIGHFFDKEQKFEAGNLLLKVSHPNLAQYLSNARLWWGPLQTARNNLEHGTFPSPEINYNVNIQPIEVEEPKINGLLIREFVENHLSKTMCFVEEVTTYCLQQKMPKGFSITEISVEKRTSESPTRFRLTVVPAGDEIWEIKNSNKSFEQT